MDYEHIKSIRTDNDPLSHWEDTCGLFSTVSGEHLRFILTMNIPLEKFIRYELAIRGYDQNHSWVGFYKSQEVWLQ